MTYEITSVLCAGEGPWLPARHTPEDRIHRWTRNVSGHGLDNAIINLDNHLSPCECYQQLLEDCESDVLMVMHDDLCINDPGWIEKVMQPFGNDKIVAVGLGGATALGHPDMYKRPYNKNLLARSGYASNQEDAEAHGERFTGVRRVAVFDQFFIAFRTSWLWHIGGFPTDHIGHTGIDMWLACAAARHSKELWMVGADCKHYGGGSSTKGVFQQASWLHGYTPDQEHDLAHRWIYDNFRDVLPVNV